MHRFAFPLLRAAILPCQPAAAVEYRHNPTPREAKPTLAVGAALDDAGRVWLAGVENLRLWVAWSDDGGLSRPVVVSPEPEHIAADILSNATYFVGTPPFPQRAGHAELRLDH